jgi:ATP-dependent Clp protease ATP-binding subunit ClpC
MIKRDISLYHIEDFRAYESQQMALGKTVQSISFCAKPDQISNLIPFIDIVDISAVLGIETVTQSFLEQLFASFPFGVEFVADIRHEKEVQEKLRFVIDEIHYIDVGNNSNNKQKESSLKDVNRIIDLTSDEMDEFLNLFEYKLYGHEKFKDEFRNIVNTFRVFNKIGEHNILSLFLMGESGIGKTEVARTIHQCLGGKRKLAKINFGNYSSKDALNSLIGSPRGYVGSESGELFMKVKESDTGVILIDEFEKGDSVIYNYFLDVLENGKMTSSQGEDIDLNGYIIIFTSNLTPQAFDNFLSPELRSRFNYVGIFQALKNEDKEKFVKRRMSDIIGKYNDKFEKKLPNYSHTLLCKRIDVNDYSNMRDLNQKIREVFVDYIDEVESLL